MDNAGLHENERLKTDLSREVHPPLQWTMTSQYQTKETNAFVMNKKIMQIVAEKNAATEALSRAISNRNSAIEARNEAVKLRDEAIAARDTVYRERDSAVATLRFHEGFINSQHGTIQRGRKRMHKYTEYQDNETQYTDAIPLCAVDSDEEIKPKNSINKCKPNAKFVQSKALAEKSPTKEKRVKEDLNKQVTTHGSKSVREAQDFARVGQIMFDENSMPVPVCTCTGVQRQCYKWGSGGWQSSCCTTYLSVYPLPQLPNKRHSRMGGRKMNGNVFTRLLSRVAAEGHDLSTPLDLKKYWAKHGTNGYTTIK